MSNTVTYDNNKIIFSGSTSNFTIPENTNSDFQINGNNTFHTFSVGKTGSCVTTGNLLFDSANVNVTVLFLNGNFTFYDIICSSANKKIILGNNAKLTVTNGLTGDNLEIYIMQNASFYSPSCIGSGIFYVGADLNLLAMNNSELTVAGATDNFAVRIYGNNCNVRVSNSSVTIYDTAMDTNLFGSNNAISVMSGAQESYIRGENNNVTDLGLTTNIATNSSTNPLSGAFGNLKFEENSIISTIANGNIYITPDGNGELIYTGAITNNNAITTKNYLATAISGITKASIGLGNVANTKNNIATVNPTGTDDTTQGYSIGSQWVNTLSDTVYYCTDSTANSALWREVTNINNIGDVNAAANVGTGGIGVFANKSGGTLNFKNIASGNATINVTELNNTIQLSAIPSAIDHNSLLNYVANQHVDHSTVNIIAGTGLNGGGTIATSRTLSLAINGLTTGTVDPSADFIPIFDVSGNTHIKVLANTVGIQSHSQLNGLANDDHNIYALLAGRTTGQTLYGGNANNGLLTLSSTSAATKGYTYFPDNIPSTNVSSGTVVIAGGLGVSEKINCISANIGNLSFNMNTISAITGEILLSNDPISDLAIATKRYVDSVASGLDFKSACIAKAVTLPSYNFSAGVITATNNGNLPTIDGVSMFVGARILLDTGNSQVENGIYDVTSLGSGSTKWQLTRSADTNASSEVTNGMFVFVTGGNSFANNGYVLSTSDPITINTTPLLFTQFSAGQTYSAGNETSAGIGVYSQITNNKFLFRNILSSSTIAATLVNTDIILSVDNAALNHNLLSNLNVGDVHTQYTLLAGRAGGQTIVGGTTSGNLILASNQNNNGLVMFTSDIACEGKIIYGNDIAGTRLLLRGNNVDLLGGVTIQSTTAATTTDAALIVSGGALISNNLFVGSNLSIANTTLTSISSFSIVAPSGINTANTVLIRNATASSSGTTGALIVTGGIGAAGTSFFSGLFRVSNATASTSSATGAAVLTGGIGVGGNSFFAGITTISNATASSSGTTGALIVTGGIGAAGTSFFSGLFRVSNATASTSSITGAAVVTGGIGVGGNSFFAGITTISNVTSTTGSTTGALVIAGGVGIAGNIIGNNLNISGNNTANGTLTLRGTSLDTSGSVQIVTTTASASVTTGALIVSGGIGAANLFATSINSNTILSITGAIASASQWTFTNSTIATNITGAIVVSGGVLIQSNLRVTNSINTPLITSDTGTLTIRPNELLLTGAVSFPGTDNATSTTTGAVTIAGGLGVNNAIYATSAVIPTISGGIASNSILGLRGTLGNTTGSIRIYSTTTSTSISTGALIVDGGIGVANNSFFGANATVAGIVSVTNATAATSNTNGAVIVSGGIAVALGSYIAGISIINTTIAGSSLTLSSATSTIGVSNTISIASANNVITANNLVFNTSSSTSIASNGTSLSITGGTNLAGLVLYGSTIANGFLSLQGNNTTATNGYVIVTNNTTASNSTTGSFIVSGGVAIGDNLIIANSLESGNAKISTTSNNVLLETKANNGNLSLIPNGTGEVLLKAAPVGLLGAATKGYVDAGNYLNLSGEASTTNGTVVTLTNAAVISKVLTGFVSGSGNVASTDTILAAIQKLDGKLSGNGTAGYIPVYSSSKVLTNDANFTFFSGATVSTLAINSGSGDACTVTGNKELILQCTGDQFGASRLLIRNRNAENGIIIETLNAGAAVADLIVKNAGGQRNIRVESRSAFARAGVSSFHIGGTVPDNPTLAIGDAILNTNTTATLCIGGYLVNNAAKLHITDSGTATASARFTNSNTGVNATDGLEIGYGTSNAFINNFEATDLTIATNNTTRLTVTSAGQIIAAQLPSTDFSVATRSYVDFLPGKQSCRVRAVGLGGVASGGPGPGRIITASPAAAMPQIDGITIALGDRIFYDTGSANAANGVYTVTQIVSPWIITRSSDADTNAKLQAGATIYIQEGAVNSGRNYILTTANPITIDTTSLLFSQGASTISTISHAALAGLANDDHNIYALLAGRGTSQTINGGVNSGNNLILRANAANTTTGSVQILTSTAATTASTGALVVSGGVGIAEGVYVGKTGGGTISINGVTANTIAGSTSLAITAVTNVSLSGSTVSISGTSGITLSPGNNTIVTGNITLNNSTNTISSTNTNGNIILSPNGTGRVQVNAIPLANNDVATKQYTGFGGTCRVDAFYGNNTTATRNGGAFTTISAAIAAALSGDTIVVFPGSYEESFTIPTGVAVVGISQRSCIITVTNPAVASTAVTMGDNTTIENCTIVVTTTNNVAVTGLLFPNTSATTAIVSNCTINVTKNNTGAATAYGIYANGTGIAGILGYNVSQCTINVSSTGTGINRGIYANTAVTLKVSCSAISCTGTNAIGVETNNASSTIVLMSSTITGATADISETLGAITLNSGILTNNNANGLSFSDIGSHYRLFFADPSTIGAGITYFYMGTENTITTELLYTFAEPAIVYNIFVNARVANTGSIVFTVRKNQINTTVTTTLAANTTSATNNANSVAFAAGDTLSVSANRTGNSATDITVVLLVR